jgi:hypothetical protein
VPTSRPGWVRRASRRIRRREQSGLLRPRSVPGDFNPVNHLYYGLEFTAFDPTAPTFINVVDPFNGTLTRLAQTVDGLHVLAFVKD